MSYVRAAVFPAFDLVSIRAQAASRIQQTTPFGNIVMDRLSGTRAVLACRNPNDNNRVSGRWHVRCGVGPL